MTAAAQEPFEAAKLLKAAKTTPVNFAFGFATDPLDGQLLVDRRQDGARLFAILRKEGCAKGFFGTATCDGSTAIIVVDKDGSRHRKALEVWFKRNSLGLKVEIVEPGASDPQPAMVESSAAVNAPKPTPRPEPARDDIEEQEAEDDEEPGPGTLFARDRMVKLLKLARKTPVTFAYGRCGDPGADRLGLHARFSGLKLAKIVKQEIAAKSGSWGTVTIDGHIATFACEKKPVSGLRMSLRALLAGHGLPLQVVVLGPDRQVHPDEDPAQDEAEPQAPMEAGREDQSGRIRSRIKELIPTLRELATIHPEAEPRLADAYQAALDAFGIGALDQAEVALGVLLDAISGLQPPMGGPDTGAEAISGIDVIRTAWTGAVRRTTVQFETLRDVLLSSQDPDLHVIARTRLDSLMEALTVPLSQALAGTQGQPSGQLDTTRIRAAISSVRGKLDDDLLATFERNPFGVRITARRTLSAALADMERSLPA
ncbi:hypothetical protein [Arenibaculum pallidiluteum]|uniref:hypothetical protein n=1 Tax=Arenibaculum pallidiluteum TaxID=2812559 RepID=UPI001A960BAD|nr:hypothetical protein [Arenibaculum pallidiluteum]